MNGIKKARTLKSEGWDNIVKEIKSTGEGSVIEITLNDETTMPEDALQAAIDRKMKLIMDAGFGRIWEIDGAKAVPGKYIDLSISGVDVGIPEDSYAGILCSDSRQLRINARLLNFTAQLTAFIGKDNIGQNAALYSYNDETGKLVFRIFRRLTGTETLYSISSAAAAISSRSEARWRLLRISAATLTATEL